MSQRVYKYVSTQPLYAHSWVCREDKPMHLAVCSCDDENRNFCELVRLKKSANQIIRMDSAAHQYPITKVQFMPSSNTANQDLMITASDSLRTYKIVPDNNGEKMVYDCSLKAEKRRPSPVTSFDWSPLALNVIASASFDTLISVWDLNKQCLDLQFAGHDRAVNDISFSPYDQNLFVTCSTDGCLRLFDRRHMDHCNQLYDANTSLLRCQFNRVDQNYIGFIENDKNDLSILDIRNTSQLLYLKKHQKPINSFTWSPSQQNIVLSVAEDGNCYLWDAINAKNVPRPTMGYDCKEAVSCCNWSNLNKEWCSVIHDKTLELLHI